MFPVKLLSHELFQVFSIFRQHPESFDDTAYIYVADKLGKPKAI